MLTKMAFKTIKTNFFLKNNWKKYEILSNISDHKELTLLTSEIKNAVKTIATKNNDYNEAQTFKVKNFIIRKNDFKNPEYYSQISVSIETEIREFIWKKIDEKITAFVLAPLVKNQTSDEIKEADAMNQMLDEYQNKASNFNN